MSFRFKGLDSTGSSNQVSVHFIEDPKFQIRLVVDAKDGVCALASKHAAAKGAHFFCGASTF